MLSCISMTSSSLLGCFFLTVNERCNHSSELSFTVTFPGNRSRSSLLISHFVCCAISSPCGYIICCILLLQFFKIVFLPLEWEFLESRDCIYLIEKFLILIYVHGSGLIRTWRGIVRRTGQGRTFQTKNGMCSNTGKDDIGGLLFSVTGGGGR